MFVPKAVAVYSPRRILQVKAAAVARAAIAAKAAELAMVEIREAIQVINRVE